MADHAPPGRRRSSREPAHPVHPDPEIVDPLTLPRRDFLKLGATGLTASMVGDTGVQAGPRLAPNSPQEVDAPPVGNLVDPKRLPAETWQEPWTWRVGDWPDGTLTLDVVERQNPGPSPSSGNQVPSLFSYGGTSPGPTIRARGQDVVRVAVRNHLGLDRQLTPVGPCPDIADLLPADDEDICMLAGETRSGPFTDPDDPRFCPIAFPFFSPEETFEVLPVRRIPGHAMVHHANGQRTAHVTNIHTHGLHVPPNYNLNGTLSDNVVLRVLPKADWAARQADGDPALAELGPEERVGEAEYEFHLGAARHGAPDGAPPQPHPPGTHWYHPHAHGSTHDQVSSGMAGFFIVEGDVDDAINRTMTGSERPDPTERAGPYDYRERLLFIQRVFVNSLDLDAGRRRNQLRFPPVFAINGSAEPGVFRMRPGAVERWRVLNGSVDGSGTKRFMVLEGQFVFRRNRLWRVVEEPAAPEDAPGGTGGGGGGGGGGGNQAATTRRLVPATRQDVDDAKLPLHLLAFDGITLVRSEDGQARHVIRDLSRQNAGTVNPMSQPPRDGEDVFHTSLRNIEDSFRDGDSLSRCFNRPNEVYLGNANRADVFFKAPTDAAGKVFTVFAQEVHVHTDNTQQLMQFSIQLGRPFVNRPPFDVVAAYIYVDGDAVEGGDFDVMSLEADLPPVPPFLQPIEADELRVPAAEAAQTGVAAGSYRTRVVSYSGTGGADWPLIRVPEDFVEAHPQLERLVWARHADGTPVLLPNYTRTMGINVNFDLAKSPDPGPAMKFMPDDPDRIRTLVGTAEEWALYNCSQMLWSHTDTDRFPQPGQWKLHWEAYPLSRAEGQRRFWEDSEFRITSKGSDHPFHIHINPIWVLRVDVPDERGELHNILNEPRWMDTVPVPRNGGRVVFRTRFLDFPGKWVNHCHILLHEDNGMMTLMECTESPAEANYNPKGRVATADADASSVDELYPRPTPAIMYRQNMSFVDPNPETGQVYPGFELQVPELADE